MPSARALALPSIFPLCPVLLFTVLFLVRFTTGIISIFVLVFTVLFLVVALPYQYHSALLCYVFVGVFHVVVGRSRRGDFFFLLRTHFAVQFAAETTLKFCEYFGLHE